MQYLTDTVVKLYATVMYHWFFCVLEASDFHNLRITCPWGLLVPFFYHDMFFLWCTQWLLSYTTTIHYYVLWWNFIWNFLGCPWDLRTKSSVGSCGSCPSKFGCYYVLPCSFWTSIESDAYAPLSSCAIIAGKTSNVRDCSDYQRVQESSFVGAYRGVWLRHHLVIL